QGSFNLGPVATRGTYSWTKSRILGVKPEVRGRLNSIVANNAYAPGASFRVFPEHTWAWGVTYTHANTSMGLDMTGIGQLQSLQNMTQLERISTGVRLQVDRYSMINQEQWTSMNAGYAMMDLTMQHRLSSRVQARLQVTNLGDFYRHDY